ATSSRVRWRATRFLPSGRRAEYERPAIPCPELVDASSCAGASIRWCSHGLQADGEVAVCGGRLSLVGNSGTKKSYGQTTEQSKVLFRDHRARLARAGQVNGDRTSRNSPISLTLAHSE